MPARAAASGAGGRPAAEAFHWFNWHFGGYDRKKSDEGLQSHIPGNLGEVADYYRRFIEPPDLVVLKTCPMDQNGFCFSSANLVHPALVDRAKVLVVEVNEHLPYLYGFENGVHVSEVDYAIDGDDAQPPELPNPAPTDPDRVVEMLTDGIIDLYTAGIVTGSVKNPSPGRSCAASGSGRSGSTRPSTATATSCACRWTARTCRT